MVACGNLLTFLEFWRETASKIRLFLQVLLELYDRQMGNGKGEIGYTATIPAVLVIEKVFFFSIAV